MAMGLVQRGFIHGGVESRDQHEEISSILADNATILSSMDDRDQASASPSSVDSLG